MTDDHPEADREYLRGRYEEACDPPVDGHDNFGDVNPGPHGGIWVSYDPDHGEWEVYETIQSATYAEDSDPEDLGDQFVSRTSIQFRDLVTEDGEWTEQAQRLADELHNSHQHPLGAIVDDLFTSFAAHFGSDRAEFIPYQDPRQQADSYDDLLAQNGIEPRDE